MQNQFQIEHIIGLPWQLAEPILQAASIPYDVEWGNNYNKFFAIAEEGAYVARVTPSTVKDKGWHILVYRPMIASGFRFSNEVEYAEFHPKTKN